MIFSSASTEVHSPSSKQIARASSCARHATIEVVERSIYRGPNLYSRRPTVRIRVDLGELEAWPSDRLVGFADRLLAILPGLHNHHCSKGRVGGFVERLIEGTWLGHIAEHVAIELQVLAGARVSRGKTRSVRGRPGTYDILFEYVDERAALLAGLHALELLAKLSRNPVIELRGLSRLPKSQLREDVGIADIVAELAALIKSSAFGPSTQSIVDAAKRRGIPVRRLDSQSLLQLGFGSRQKRMRASITGDTSHIAVETAGNKQLTRTLLADAALPVPRGVVVRSVDDARQAATGLRKPLVVKPLSANHGRGVTLNIADEGAMDAAFALAKVHGSSVIVEEQLPGIDHRFLVVGGKVVAVARRHVAAITGDGVHDVENLVARANEDPRRGSGHENSLTRITIDTAALSVLADQGLSPQSIPALGQAVRIRDTANLSTGGTAEDCTHEVHPDNIFVAEQAAAIVGLDVAGVDFLSPDISRPVSETGGGIVELNAAPGLRMHVSPSSGEARDVGQAIVDHLFPDARASRIPVVAITGTNGKSTTARMTARILRAAGLNVGLTSTSGVYINEHLIRSADASGPKSAQMVLANPRVDAAVLETARGGILREGLGFDYCDVGCLLNITEDHMGLKGIDTLGDLANVKSVVVGAVKRRGVSVLNADDPMVLSIARRARGRICWFSMRGIEAVPDPHIADGGMAVVFETYEDKQAIFLYHKGERQQVIATDEIPATQNGAAAFNTANALAATAIAAALEIQPQVIALGLSSFTTSWQDSPGRLNIAERHGITVIVDYAHNPAAVQALAAYLDTLRRPGRRFIGTYSVPGDRRNEDLIGMGRLTASIFDDLVFRETPDGRGRPAGEINALMSRGALEGGMSADHIHRVIDEIDATRFAIALARPGDVVVLSPTQVDTVWKVVNSFEPHWQCEEAHG